MYRSDPCGDQADFARSSFKLSRAACLLTCCLMPASGRPAPCQNTAALGPAWGCDCAGEHCTAAGLVWMCRTAHAHCAQLVCQLMQMVSTWPLVAALHYMIHRGCSGHSMQARMPGCGPCRPKSAPCRARVPLPPVVSGASSDRRKRISMDITVQVYARSHKHSTIWGMSCNHFCP